MFTRMPLFPYILVCIIILVIKLKGIFVANHAEHGGHHTEGNTNDHNSGKTLFSGDTLGKGVQNFAEGITNIAFPFMIGIPKGTVETFGHTLTPAPEDTNIDGGGGHGGGSHGSGHSGKHAPKH